MVRVVIDVAMCALLLHQTVQSYAEPSLHAVEGALLAALTVVHNALNAAWWRALPRGRWSAERILRTVLNLLSAFAMAGMALTGIAMGALEGALGPVAADAIQRAHMVCGYGGLLVISGHAGLHLKMPRTVSEALRPGVYALAIGVAAVGAYELLALGVLDYVTLRTRYSFEIMDASPLELLVRYASVMWLFACTGRLAELASKRLHAKRKDLS